MGFPDDIRFAFRECVRLWTKDCHQMNATSVRELRDMLAADVKRVGGQKAWAKLNGVSGAYVCDVLKGRREPGEAISRCFGLRPETMYVTHGDLTHKWSWWAVANAECCDDCGIIRRQDRKNKPCPGKVTIGLRAQAEAESF